MRKEYSIGETFTLPDGTKLEVCLGKSCEHCYFWKHQDMLCPNCGESLGYFDGSCESSIIFCEVKNQ